ncbi:hypothetical protein [Salmonirosea aquatica]|uniref:Uncharacterized protein n=1 Tax=Salmonirosea aquatica TaxID=2654236 RepID=A0A7C9BD37_9BACT|nr:hypothetical protein [Cytophagaceae bacterium SJW1-29]
MKSTATFLALSLAALLFSCEKPNEIDEDKPRIKSISISGIPDKDIEFIPERYVINVQLPAMVPEGGLKPNFQLTENTEILEGLTPAGTFESRLLCGDHSLNTSNPTTLIVANDKKTAIYRNTTTYQINFIRPLGCPEVLGNIPITYSRDSSNANSMQIQVPLQNPFSSFKVFAIRLKNLSTGAQHDNTLPSYLGDYFLNRCPSGIDNRVSLFYTSSPKVPPGPGSYEVSVTMNCGESQRTLTFPQPLVIAE